MVQEEHFWLFFPKKYLLVITRTYVPSGVCIWVCGTNDTRVAIERQSNTSFVPRGREQFQKPLLNLNTCANRNQNLVPVYDFAQSPDQSLPDTSVTGWGAGRTNITEFFTPEIIQFRFFCACLSSNETQALSSKSLRLFWSTGRRNGESYS